ncbi:MAG: LysM peptidoglycan-binding domain-containing protein [Tannerella sp.]|jgi:LysM repeat protein|nr:LysM peptidoglycan-binding domain-containing protein [Tannerella sp.]
MKNYGFYFIVLALCASVQVSLPQRAGAQESITSVRQDERIFYHTVERGQTVYSIGLMYGVSEDDIFRLNPSSRRGIRAGEQLRIPQNGQTDGREEGDDEIYVYHTIRTGETLYGVSREYGLSTGDLSEANRGLTPETFAAGKTIRIPSMKIHSLPVTQTKVVVKELKYKIKRRETMYSICRKFDVTSEDLLAHNPQLKSGLKAGMELIIPVRTEEVVTEAPVQKELDIAELTSYRRQIERTNVARLALLLPFLAPGSQTPLDARVIEFYEGFLIAVDSVRNSGMSVELYVYNIGNDAATTATALENIEAPHLDLIVGGMTDIQIELIADFARDHDTKYVVPFSSRCERLTLDNPCIFQVNAATQNLYSYLTPRIHALFPRHRIILLDTGDGDPKTQLFNVIRADLNDSSIPFTEVTYREKTFQADMLAAMSNTAPSLVIPLSGSLDALLKIKSTLRSIVETRPEYAVTLFGHPEWQNYTKDCLDDFYALDTYFYTQSYMNAMTPEAKWFAGRYRDSYNKPLPATSPRYAVLGYDLGMYFLTALRAYGSAFDSYVAQHAYRSIQSGFRFGRVNNWGGFFNTNLYIVHYNGKDYSILREE